MTCGTCRLQQLQKLSLQSNRLTAVDELATCTMLEELWLSHNGITSLQVFPSLPNMHVQDASFSIALRGSWI